MLFKALNKQSGVLMLEDGTETEVYDYALSQLISCAVVLVLSKVCESKYKCKLPTKS